MIVCMVSGSFLAWSQQSSSFSLGEQSFTVSINSSAGDAEEQIHDGLTDLDSEDLELGYQRALKRYEVVALRFTDVPVPRNAIIKDARVRFSTDESGDDELHLLIYRDKKVPTAPFSRSNWDLSSRFSDDDECVLWDVEPWERRGKNNKTPNLKDLVQDVVDDSNWNAGGDMVLLFVPDQQFRGHRAAVSCDALIPSETPQLSVRYWAY